MIRFLDLTSLSAVDTPAVVRALCARGVAPAPSVPAVAAVCVWPAFVATARAAVAGSSVRVASVGAGFPHGQLPPGIRTVDVQAALDAGADEIDMVIPRGSFLAGDMDDVRHAIEGVAALCNSVTPAATLKVILETCELGDDDAIRAACDLAVRAAEPTSDGAMFLKTSTGHGAAGATVEHVRLLCEAAREHADRTGVRIGIKPAGGIRRVEEAQAHAACVADVLGPAWLEPRLFRIGASSLLEALVAADAESAIEAGHPS